MPVSHFDKSGSGVVIPVGDTISDGKTLKVGLEDGIVSSVVSVVLVNEVGHIRDVNSTVTLSRNIKIVLNSLRELYKPLFQSNFSVV